MFYCTINYVPLYNVFSPLYIKHYALTLYYIIAFLHSSTKTYKEECISDLMFSQWCSAGFRSVRNTLSLGKQFLTSSIPLWPLHPEDILNTVHHSTGNHTPSKTSNNGILAFSGLLRTFQNRVCLQNYTKERTFTPREQEQSVCQQPTTAAFTTWSRQLCFTDDNFRTYPLPW